MFGVSYQGWARPSDADELLDDPARPACRLQGLAQHDDIEAASRIGFEITVGVALNHRQAMADTGVDARLAQFDASAVHVFLARQVGKQRTVAASDVEHPRAGLDHLRDQPEVLAQLTPSAGGRSCLPGRAEIERGAFP